MNNFKFFVNATYCSAKSAMEYKVSFFIQSIFMFINNGFWLLFWAIIFNANGSDINGVNMDTMLYLWSIPVISYGVAFFFFGGADNISNYIISGQMDSYMLQPKHPLLNILTSKCNFAAFGDIVYGLVLGFIVVDYDLLKFLLIIIFGIFGSVFYVATNIIIRSLSTWLGDTDIIASRYIDTLITTFTIYPEKIFDGLVKVLLYTVIPAAYLAHMPINIVINFNLTHLLIIFAVGILYIIVAVLVFNKAMKSYESGNTISMRN